MKYSTLLIFNLFILTVGYSQQDSELKTTNTISNLGYNELVDLFKEWRAFEKPPLKDGASDYTKATLERRQPQFINLQEKLKSIDTTDWSTHNKVDWMVVWAEMNGYDFNYRVLKPWQRDPAFYKTVWSYQSDVPAHEGPTNHSTVELWKYDFPLSKENSKKLAQDLKAITPINNQAKLNLTGNAKDLWITGIRDIREQEEALVKLKADKSVQKDSDLLTTIDTAISSTQDLIQWLTEQSKNKTGPSGIGKENYTWYNKNVRLVPLSWDDEVMLLKRELARAWSSLKLEEHRNRNLPQLEPVDSPDAYDTLADNAVNSMITFLEDQEIVTVKPYFKQALVDNKGEFVPAEKRNFFLIGEHYDPRPLYSHFYHWFELARMVNEPNPSKIRQGPLLYNIFDSRNEGTATAVEEMFMQAGLYEDSPRTREIVYIMIAQRAARGLGSLYAHANEMTMEEAGKIHSEFTPRGWMKTEKDLLIFEQHLYLRQPGYGTSYIVGKYMLEAAMAEFARQKELNNEPFSLKHFFDTLNSIGNIPISLGHWEMTGTEINQN